MRFTQYIRNNMKQKPGRTTLTILGIMLSVIDILVMSLLIWSSMSSTSAFFIPFSHMDQIIEKGTDFTQMVPLSSTMNESLRPAIETFFDEIAIPMLMIAESEEISTLNSIYYIGLPLESMEIIWDQVKLGSGYYPTQLSQVIVGDQWDNLTEVEIKGSLFTVTGVLNSMHTFLNRVIVMNLKSLQELVNKTGLVTLFFISPEASASPAIIEQFENEFSTLDYLTLADRDELRGSMDRFVSELASLFTTFTAISAIIFVFAVELLTILSRKGDFNVFFVLGAPKLRIFLFLILELLLLFFIGIIFSIPLSLALYIIIWSYINAVLGGDKTFWHKMGDIAGDLIQDFPTTIFFSRISLILVFGLIFALIIAIIGLRTYKLEEMKQKF